MELVASPDGRRLAVVFQGGKLALVDFETGQTTWHSFPGIQRASWSSIGEQVLLSGFGLLARAQADGSGLIPLRSIEGTAFARFGANDDIYYGLLGDAIYVIRSDGKTDSLVTGGVATPETPLEDGSMFISVRGNPAVNNNVTWNARTGKVTKITAGNTYPLTAGLWVTQIPGGNDIVRKAGEPLESGLPLVVQTYWWLSPDGTLFDYSTQQAQESFDIWMQRPDGTSIQLAYEVADDYFDVSPDKRRLVLHGRTTTGERRTHVVDLESGITSTIAENKIITSPVWDPSGTMIYGYHGQGVVRTPASRSEAPELLVENIGRAYPIQWYPDGEHIGWPHFMTEGGLRTGFVRYHIALDSLEWVTGPSGPQDTHSLSPDGRFVSYVDLTSAAAGHTSFNVVELETKRSWPLVFPGFDGSGLTIDNLKVNWAPDGKEIDYIIGDSLMALPVDTQDGFRVTGPSRVVAVIEGLAWAERHADGTIYYSRRTTPASERPDRLTIKVQLNWLQDLERRLEGR